MLVAVPLRDAGGDHVRVVHLVHLQAGGGKGGDLEDIVLVGDTVEHGVQRVEEISHLGRLM